MTRLWSVTRTIGGTVAALLFVTLHARTASAEEASASVAKAPEKRGTSAGEVLRWVPKVLGFPVYAVTEYGIHRPLSAVLDRADTRGWVTKIAELWTFGPEGRIGIVPSARFDLGLRPSLGIYGFYDDFLTRKNALRLHAATGGSDWLSLTVADRMRIAEGAQLSLRFDGSTLPDQLFYGIGARSLESHEAIYGATSFSGSARFVLDPAPYLHVEAEAEARSVGFDARPRCCGKTPIAVRAAVDGDALPAGFARGITVLGQALHMRLDSRPPRPDPQSGLMVEGELSHGIDLRDPAVGRWVGYGVGVGGSAALDAEGRTLLLTVTTRFVDPQGNSAVPFTELISLGGDAEMPGFLPGRLRDRSSAVAALTYRYPIWRSVEGSAEIAVGNVFGAQLKDFSPKRMRFSFDAGIHTQGSPDHTFDLLVGAGTETFEDGAALNALRLKIGTTRHF
ncbi:MAG: hypothetical protein U0359_27780 [Byssovorax sp.]